jgi:hypothetical protein
MLQQVRLSKVQLTKGRDKRINGCHLIQPPRRRDPIFDCACERAVPSEVSHFGFDVLVGKRLLQAAAGVKHGRG